MLKNNPQGQERQIGFEIEYAGLPLENVAQMVHQQFGGKLEQISPHVYAVNQSELGDFKLELDSIPLQKLATSNASLKDSQTLYKSTQYKITEMADELGTKIVPYEIVCPPVKLSQIPALETLCENLRNQGAKGTKGSLLYAFGLHLNPELASFEAHYILRHLQSFLILGPWLQKEHHVDISRKLTNFIDPFPKEYAELVLDQDYQPNIDQLIRDYHTHNPTRNRALDMLPLFAHLDESLIIELYGEEEKINKRPTFHYRLPNCEIGQSNWSLTKEWETWLSVEKVANSEQLFGQLLTKWQTHHQKLISTDPAWVKEVDDWMKKANV